MNYRTSASEVIVPAPENTESLFRAKRKPISFQRNYDLVAFKNKGDAFKWGNNFDRTRTWGVRYGWQGKAET